MNINVQDIILKAHKRIDKKYMDDPSYLLRKRVLNTAASVLEKIDDITFEDLASDNFFICKEVVVSHSVHNSSKEPMPWDFSIL